MKIGIFVKNLPVGEDFLLFLSDLLFKPNDLSCFSFLLRQILFLLPFLHQFLPKSRAGPLSPISLPWRHNPPAHQRALTVAGLGCLLHSFFVFALEAAGSEGFGLEEAGDSRLFVD